MLQRDYIMRLIHEFYEALELFLNKDVSKRKEEIQKMYDQYVGPYAFYHTAAIEDVMKSMEQFDEKERLPRLEMLAELYYDESELMVGPMRTIMLKKALFLFDFLDHHARTFDMNRLNKMNKIKTQLDNK